MTEPKKPRPSDVRYQEVTYRPVAECRGRWEADDRVLAPGGGPADEYACVEECDWILVAASGVDRGDVKKGARRHALSHPGHEVTVTRRTVATYWLPLPDPTETETETETEEVRDA